MASELRKRFEEDLKLAGYSERTQEASIREVCKRSEHYRRKPDTITEVERYG